MLVDYLANGFRTVDEQTDIAKFGGCLTFLDSLPSFSMYKAYLCTSPCGRADRQSM